MVRLTHFSGYLSKKRRQMWVIKYDIVSSLLALVIFVIWLATFSPVSNAPVSIVKIILVPFILIVIFAWEHYRSLGKLKSIDISNNGITSINDKRETIIPLSKLRRVVVMFDGTIFLKWNPLPFDYGGNKVYCLVKSDIQRLVKILKENNIQVCYRKRITEIFVSIGHFFIFYSTVSLVCFGAGFVDMSKIDPVYFYSYNVAVIIGGLLLILSMKRLIWGQNNKIFASDIV